MKNLSTPLAVAALVLLTGCQKKSTPAAPEDSPPAAAHADEGVDESPHADVSTPAPDSPDAPSPAGSGETITVSGLAFTVPEGWRSAPPANMMRLAELHVESPDGAESIAVFSVAGGDPDLNISRWVGQFGRDAGEALKSRETRTINNRTVHLVEMSGTYHGMGMTPPQPDTMMRAAIVEQPGEESLFIKMTGPISQMEALAEGWNTLINSMHTP